RLHALHSCSLVAVKITTWNVNGIRARAAQVSEWLDTEQPDVVCLQEVKAHPDKVPLVLSGRDDYWSCWHGGGGYSGVAILVRRPLAHETICMAHPSFDMEHRAASVQMDGLEVLSVYVPN